MTGIDVQIDDDIMVPVSIINRMRREACDSLMSDRLADVKNSRKNKLSRAELDVAESAELLGKDAVDTAETERRINSGSIKAVALESFMKTKRSGGKLPENAVPYILNISKGNLDRFIEENFEEITDAVRETGILIGNLGWIERFIEAGIKVYADYGLNIYNRQAEKAFEEISVEPYMLSHETGICDARGIPLMITEHRIDAEILTDRKGKKHKIISAESDDKTIIL
jgi:hypothetical protein